MKKKAVCVTGASGFIGSCLVQLLLNRGYTVHATVQNLNEKKETEHLMALEGVDEERLKLFEMDLLNYPSILAAVKGTHGVFHIASPNIIAQVEHPEKELLEPAIEGTINVITAAEEAGIERVVVTSSTAAIMPNPCWPADVPKSEACWTDEAYCRNKGLWYPVSKLCAEKAAWKVAGEKGIELVVVNPAAVLGPVLPPALSASMVLMLGLLQGSTETYENFYMGCVHVKDVAMAHILLYENKSAAGRHLCCKDITHFSDLAAKVAQLYPQYNVPRFPKDTQPGLVRKQNAGKKLMDLGLQFTPIEEIIKDSIDTLIKGGYISASGNYELPISRNYSRGTKKEPDTIILRGLPSRWFAEPRVSSKPSMLVTHTIFSTFGKIRNLNVAEDDDLGNDANADNEDLISGLQCKVVVQFEQYKEFYNAMKVLCGRSLQKEGSRMKADYEVTWDKDGYFQSSRRHTQDNRNDGPRRRSYNSRYSPEDVRSKRYKE